MRKKSIILLLVLPFIIAIFAFVTSSVFIRSVERNITGIRWDYISGEQNPFSLSQKRTLLEASAIYDERYPLSSGNELRWECTNPENTGESDVAYLETEGDNTYLVFKKEGLCRVTCSNEKGNVSDYFLARIVGDGGAIIVTPTIPFSSQSLTSIRHVGLYDSVQSYQTSTPDSVFSFDLEIFGTTSFDESDIQVENTNNVEVDLSHHEINLLQPGEASITFVNPVSSTGNSTLSFKIEEAMNVYDYDDLMAATNQSENGVPVVLRKNLLPFSRTYTTDDSGNLVPASNNVALFGKMSGGQKQSFSPADLYSFETTYDHSYLDKWNETMTDYPISTTRYAAVHIQQDFYGNGFEINLHDLCYPSHEQTITDSLGNETTNAVLGDNDLYRGPLLYVSLGIPNTPGVTLVKDAGLPIFALYGQDNVGFYVDGEDILLDDVHFANADTFSANLTNLTYTGTVVEVDGDNVTIQNSILEKGRNVLRSYSNQNLVVDNCLLQNGMEFLFKTGSNEFNEVDPKKSVTYEGANGVEYTTTAGEYLTPSLETSYLADSLLSFGAIYGTQANEFVGTKEGSYTKQEYIDSLSTIADALTNTNGFLDNEGNKNYKGTTTIKDTFFYNSGISAIELDTIAQGSYLYSNITSLLAAIVGIYFGDVQPSDMARTSYPVLVSLDGDCRFYDWKSIDNLSFESLILQNIAALILAHGGLGDGFEVSVTEDDYLPLRLLIERDHPDIFVDKEEEDYLNIPVFYNGGGYNDSDVLVSEELSAFFGKAFEVDPYVYSLDLKQDPVSDFNSSPRAKYQAMKIAMLRAASNITGFHPYRFLPLSSEEGKWLGEAPSLSDLQNRS